MGNFEFKGTKGKWKLHKHAFACVVSDESSLLVSNCGGRTSNVNADELHIEQQANALLISKAPEMLFELNETLKDLLVLQGNVLESSKIDKRWDGMCELIQIWIDRKKQLIKEATEL